MRAAIGYCCRAAAGTLADADRARRAWQRVVRADCELARRMDSLWRITSRGDPYARAQVAPRGRMWRLRALCLIAYLEGARGDAGRRLWAGRDRVGQPDAAGRYQRASGDPVRLGGLASRLRISVRHVGRCWALLERAGVLISWQPQAPGGGAPERLPKAMIGRLREGVAYAYRRVHLVVQPPAELAAALQPRRPRARTAEPPPDRPPPLPPDRAAISPDGAQVAAELLALIEA